MKISLATMSMGKPVDSATQWASRIRRIAFENRGSDILVLPEYAAMQLLDYCPDDLKETEEVAWLANEFKEKDVASMIADVAKTYKMDILAGSCPVETSRGFVNRAMYIDKDGIFAAQDKMHLTYEETDRMGWYLKRGKKLEPFSVDGVKMAIAICHDVSSKEEFDLLKDEDVNLVFMISMCEFEGNGKSVDGHKWIFEHARKRSEQMLCNFVCVGSVGHQILNDSRKQNNIGGAALYSCGVAVAEIGPFSTCKGATSYVMTVDVDV